MAQLTEAEKVQLRALIDKVLASEVVLVGNGANLQTELRAVPAGTVVDGGGHIFEGNIEVPEGVTLQNVVVVTPNNGPAFIPASDTNLLGVTATAATYATELVRYEGVERVRLEQSVLAGLTKRGVRANAAHLNIVDTRIVGCVAEGQDSQAICGWDGSSNVFISGCHLEASGENIMFGGADSKSAERVPTDIWIRRNTLIKPLEWKGTRYTVKNLFELKAAKNVLFEENVLENNWLAAQTGYAVLLKSVNQDGNAPWSVVHNVVIRKNVIRNVSAGFNLAGNPGGNATPMSHIFIHDNTLVTNKTLGGDGRAFLIQGVNDLSIEHNLCLNDGGTSFYFTQPSERFVLKGNIIVDNAYGIKGDGSGEGVATLTKYAPGAVFEGNLVVTANSAVYAPTQNLCVADLPADLSGYGPRS